MKGIRRGEILPPIRARSDTKEIEWLSLEGKDGLCPKLVLVDEELAKCQ